MAAPAHTLETRLRDDVLLSADVYRPAIDGRRPSILIRTPYGKQGHRDESIVGKALARGYAVVVQDVRGRYASAGDFDAYRHEGADGYDTIEHVASQPWCDGQVGTQGLSYPGAVQWLAAVESPPHLRCAFPAMCFSSGRRFFYFNGAFDLSWIPWTAINIAPEDRRRRGAPGTRTPAEARAAWEVDGGRSAFRHVPLRTLPLLEGVTPFYFDWLDHPDDGEYWEFAELERKYARVRVPVFNFSGWHDEGYGPVGAIANYLGLRAEAATEAARAPRLLIGPWVHGDPTPESTKVGDREFGAAAGLDYDGLVLDWCDWHTKGIDRVRREPPVRIFVMGANRWREGQAWPLPGVAPTTLHLRAGGRLSADAPRDGEASSSFVYDPNDPCEDPHFDEGLGPHDQREVARRKDVLSYASDPLDEDLEVIGSIEFRLWVASSAPDTDIVARLLDVEADGTAWNLMSPTLEVLRLKYRGGERVPVPLTPGEPVEVVLRLGVTANVFRRGHRVGVQVTSSFFPHVDRNPNTGRPSAIEDRLVPARQTVFHDSGRPSRVILPVLGP
jgi:putative CocE/NonD family hydrolase